MLDNMNHTLMKINNILDVSEITFQTFFVAGSVVALPTTATLRKLNIYTPRGELDLTDVI